MPLCEVTWYLTEPCALRWFTLYCSDFSSSCITYKIHLFKLMVASNSNSVQFLCIIVTTISILHLRSRYLPFFSSLTITENFWAIRCFAFLSIAFRDDSNISALPHSKLRCIIPLWLRTKHTCFANRCGRLQTFFAQLHVQVCLSFRAIVFLRGSFKKVLGQIAKVPAVIFYKMKLFSLCFPVKGTRITVESQSQFFAILSCYVVLPVIFQINEANCFLPETSFDRESERQKWSLSLQIIRW